MPEGPECAVVADVIRQGIGKTFCSAEVIENIPDKLHRYSRDKIDHWDKLQQEWVLSGVRTYGKLIELEMITKAGTLFGFSTLGMSGSWAWGKKYKKHKHTRLALNTSDNTLSFIDMRCYGTFRIATPDNAEEIRGKIGWDLLKQEAPTMQWLEYQELGKLRNKAIGPALLDQSIFAGLGNIYRAEVLYVLGINPNTKVKDLAPELWALVNPISHRIMKTAYNKGGSSVDTFEADGQEGQAHHDHQIYGRTRCPEGHRVSRTKMKGRTMHWCEVCQTK